MAYSALYHNSFSGIAVHETWHGTSVGGGSLTSEREVRPIPFILVRSERILLNELIHLSMPEFLVNFFLLGPAYLPLIISRVTSYLSCLSEWVLSMLLAFVSEEWPSGVFQKD